MTSFSPSGADGPVHTLDQAMANSQSRSGAVRNFRHHIGEVNPKGNPQNLVASHPGNIHAARHGIFSRDGQVLEPRAREIAESILDVGHVGPLDEVGAVEIGRLVALIEAADRDLAERGLTGRGGDARKLVQLRITASRRLESWLGCYGLTPRGRVELAREAAQGGLAAEIARRRAGSNGEAAD